MRKKIGLIFLVILFHGVFLTLQSQDRVTHIVGKNETLYGISKKYKTSVSSIIELNQLKDNSIEAGQELIISSGNRKNESRTIERNKVAEKQKKEVVAKVVSKKESIPNKDVMESKGNEIVHVVKKGESFFGLIKRYKIESSQFKKWNKLKDNDLKVGQKLIVGYKNDPKNSLATNQKVWSNESFLNPKYEPDLDAKVFVATDKSKKYSEVFEKCIAEWVDDGSFISNKSIALHTVAPAGTVITIRNIMNNKVASVKVIGKLPTHPYEENLKIKITKAIAEKLEVYDKQFRAELTYTLEEANQ